jgi:mannose-6-phosphate isomerase-like protein (cupin superfamily)
MKLPLLMTSWLALGMPLLGQGQAGTTVTPDQHVDVYTSLAIRELAQTLVQQARKSPDGSAGMTLQRYPDHFTMLSARVKDGKAELHEHYVDIFVVIGGAATLTTGGTVSAPHTVSEGEVRGDTVAGGTQQQLGEGAIVHIPAGVPHQLRMASDAPFVYYVVKVKQ